MRYMSPKRAAENRIYLKRRAEFLESHPWCEFPDVCGQPASEIHHRRGRVGALFLDERYWSAVCAPCHRWITEHPREAIELGISEKRLGGAA